MFSECSWKQCLPNKADDRTPVLELLKALKKAGHVPQDWCYEELRDFIRLAHRLCHCKPVPAEELRGAIGVAHCLIDADPCGESFVRTAKYKPRESESNYEADDPADFWKAPEERNRDDTDDDDEGGALVKGGAP